MSTASTQDLAIARRIAGGTATAADVAAVASWPIAQRAPVLGAVLALAGTADGTIRAAAIAALAGVHGVPGLRAIVAALDDVTTREVARVALRETARFVPARWAHALFHPDPEVRQAAVRDTPQVAIDMLAYLRADPACAALVANARWPDPALPLAFDLHAAQHLSDAQLVRVIGEQPSSAVRAFLESEHGRLAEDVEAYLARAAESDAPGELAGVDVLDQAFAAIDGADVDRADEVIDPAHPSRWAARALDHVIGAVATKKPSALTRRAAASLLARVVRGHASATLIGTCCALEPRVLELPAFDTRAHAAAAAGLIRFRWPVRLPRLHVRRLLAASHVRANLALAAAVAGLVDSGRLKLLRTVLGDAAIVAALIASDHGWDEICRLPVEQPAVELAWLAAVEAQRPDRFVVLGAIALLVFQGKRLEQLVDQIPRRHRERVLLATVERVRPDDPRLAAICRTIASRLDRAALLATFTTLLAEASDRGPRVALLLARSVEAKQLATVARALDDAAVLRLVGVVDGPDPLPRDRELALADALRDRSDLDVRAWALRMQSAPQAPIFVAPASRARRALDAREQDTIATCADSALELALQCALGAPVSGLCDALARRAAIVHPTACAALVGCADPLPAVARELERFSAPTHELANALDALLGALHHHAGNDTLPLLHARLWRWEAHDVALARWLEQFPSTVAALEMIEQLPGRFAAASLWTGIAEVLVFLRYRDPARFRKLADEPLAVFAAHRIDADIGVPAARIVVTLVETGVVQASAVSSIIFDRAADASALAREYLVRIARLEGMPEPPKAEAPPPPPELLDEVRACTDADALVAYCLHTRRTVVQEAALQLVLLGEHGQLRLADLLARLGELPSPVPILASIALWDSESALARARTLLDAGLAPEWQFQLCASLIARGDTALVERAFAAARAPASSAWFRRADWEALVEIAGEERCARELADSPHYHAYHPAVRALLDEWDVLPEIRDALVRFLETGNDRPLMLRRDVARRLLREYECAAALPILVAEIADDKSAEGVKFLGQLEASLLPAVLDAIVSASLVGGEPACGERRMWEVVQHVAGRVPAEVVAPYYARILEEASTAFARRAAAPHVVTQLAANARLGGIARVFAWGVRRGVELTGRLFRIHMTSDERDFGHTYLDQSKLYVSPLAMLRGELHGRDVVEGLILHELGHHVFHGGPAAAEIWKRAHAEGLGRLLNLVADEHLERNLRAIDPTYGDRLKRLGAYAFQHAAQEIPVATLLSALRGAAAPALIATPLEVAFAPDAVRVRRGSMLAELDRNGHPLARFARALRLGLGNRHADPRVAAALGLCGRDLRKLDMAGLYALTKQLAALFGGATAVARVFGGPEDLGDGGERDRDVFGAGIDDDQLQREVERVLDPKQGRGNAPLGPRDRLQINVSPDEHFEKITHVERVRGDAEQHHRIATAVARHATRLRGHLDELGLRWERANARIQGHTLDRARLRALVTRGDPRILVARTPVRRTDLFLATLVDCSSSMTAGGSMERAQRFGVLIAEAVAPLPGVEARFFGFTDSVIYDAGDAKHCGVTGLLADGGNNDAAGLFHAANVAAASRKRAKLLVMISDGLPTSCSVAALSGLVTQLTRRRGIVCAQVAVRPLEEVSFPHHVVIDDAQLDVAVARFGRMIADLTRRALGA